jgi:CheY-like chemotaxis protein
LAEEFIEMSQPLVYLIDDDIEITKVIERRFINYGCEVLTFVEPTKVITAIEGRKPQLLLVDLNLGDGLSGFDVIKTIRNDLKFDFPIIILSGDGKPSVVAHGLEIGATDFMLKPPMKQDFEEMISQYIKAENLPEAIRPVFNLVNPAHAAAKLKFKVSIEEVHPAGLVLLSDHLIKKGASLHLHGPELKAVFPNCDQVFVSVIGSVSKYINGSKVFQIHLEVGAAQEDALRDIKSFLSGKSAENASR